MQSASTAWNWSPPAEGLGARTLALRPSLCRRLQLRLLPPLFGVDPVRWRNTTRGVRLFVRTSFSGLSPQRLPDAADDHVVSALFVFGAIGLACDLADLPPLARRRLELGFLRRAYGLGFLRARRVHCELVRRGRGVRGRITLREGRIALREWFDGLDPSYRLRDQIDVMPARLDVPRRPPPRPRRTERSPALMRAR